MGKSFLKSALLTSVLALAACSKVGLTSQGDIQGEAADSAGIIGGESVDSQDNIAKTTVQIFTVQTVRNVQGQLNISGVSGCTGSILANDIILTAAHCTTDNPHYILLYFSTEAPTDMQALLESVHTNPLIRRVVGGKVASNWPKLTNEQNEDWGDIALLKFKGGLPEGYEHAQLLPSVMPLKPQQGLTLAGFGMTDGVRKVSSDRLLKVGVNVLNPRFGKSEMIVDSGNGRGPCHGDSGGPAYVNIRGKNYVAGTTSRAESQTDPNGLCIGDTVYTKVQPYAGWIRTSIKALQSPDFKPELIPQPK